MKQRGVVAFRKVADISLDILGLSCHFVLSFGAGRPAWSIIGHNRAEGGNDLRKSNLAYKSG